MTETIKAWHFVGNTLRDGRPVPEDGVWLRHEGRVRICASGLHASLRPWDALRYAPGSVLCYVECRGDVQEEIDKLVCRERRILVRADLTETFRFFARMQALSVIHLWPQSPPDVLLDYLMTGDEAIRDAASSAVRDAVRDAAWAATWAATWDVASSVASSAAWAVAWAAAWAVASSVAWAAAWDAAGDAAGQEFDELVCEQFGVEA